MNTDVYSCRNFNTLHPMLRLIGLAVAFVLASAVVAEENTSMDEHHTGLRLDLTPPSNTQDLPQETLSKQLHQRKLTDQVMADTYLVGAFDSTAAGGARVEATPTYTLEADDFNSSNLEAKRRSANFQPLGVTYDDVRDRVVLRSRWAKFGTDIRASSSVTSRTRE